MFRRVNNKVLIEVVRGADGNEEVNMSYYDIDAILTDAQKLPCTFELDVPGLGYLDGNAGETVWRTIHHWCMLYLGIRSLAYTSGYRSSQERR